MTIDSGVWAPHGTPASGALHTGCPRDPTVTLLCAFGMTPEGGGGAVRLGLGWDGLSSSLLTPRGWPRGRRGRGRGAPHPPGLGSSRTLKSRGLPLTQASGHTHSLGLPALPRAPTKCHPGFCQTSGGGASRACGSQPRKGLQRVLPAWHQLGAVTPKEAGHTRPTADGPVSDRRTYPTPPCPAPPCGHLWPVPFLSQLGPGERSRPRGTASQGPGGPPARPAQAASQRHPVWPVARAPSRSRSGGETVRLPDGHAQHAGTLPPQALAQASGPPSGSGVTQGHGPNHPSQMPHSLPGSLAAPTNAHGSEMKRQPDVSPGSSHVTQAT